MRKLILFFLFMGLVGAYHEIVCVTNSIDFALNQDLFAAIKNNGTGIHFTSASGFYRYRPSTTFLILGGPDAPEGIGLITRKFISKPEQSKLRFEKYYGTYYVTEANMYGERHKVIIVAGNSRYDTKRVGEKYRDAIIKALNPKADVKTTLDRALTLEWGEPIPGVLPFGSTLVASLNALPEGRAETFVFRGKYAILFNLNNKTSAFYATCPEYVDGGYFSLVKLEKEELVCPNGTYDLDGKGKTKAAKGTQLKKIEIQILNNQIFAVPKDE